MAPIAIEGTIGAGKSTVMHHLKLAGLSIQPEPVQKWQFLLERVYKENTGHVALQTRIMLDTCCHCPAADIVERNPLMQPLTFMPAMRAVGGQINNLELAMLIELHGRLLTWHPEGMVYLHCSLPESKRRIRWRARGREAHIEDKYLYILHAHYEEAIKRFPGAIIIDTTEKTPAEVAKECMEAIAKLRPDSYKRV